MTDTFDPDDYGLQPVQETVPRNWRRQLEAEREEYKARAEAAEAREAERDRDRIFREAGVPDDRVGQIFRRGFDGELTVAAVQADWAALAPANGDVSRSLAGHQQAQAMAAGAVPAGGSNVAAEFAALRAKARAKRNGGSFASDRQELGALIAREGVETNTKNWVLPGRVAPD